MMKSDMMVKIEDHNLFYRVYIYIYTYMNIMVY